MHAVSRILSAAAIAALSLSASRAEAAPQILGLVASSGVPTPMRCEGANCTVLLASFCLQETRPAPEDGQAYRPGPGGGLSLVVKRAGGGAFRLPANELVSLSLYSEMSTVEARLSLAKLAASGIALGAGDRISLDVAGNTVILPVPLAGDPDPQTPEEIALAVGPLRRIAAATFDTAAGSADSTRLLGLMINAMPPGDDPEPIALDGLLREVLASAGPGRFDAPTLAEVGECCRTASPSPAGSASSTAWKAGRTACWRI